MRPDKAARLKPVRGVERRVDGVRLPRAMASTPASARSQTPSPCARRRAMLRGPPSRGLPPYPLLLLASFGVKRHQFGIFVTD